jgi:plasmid stabilization system protein ParE
MKYVFHPQARRELNKTIDYYEDCKKGLGKAFAKEVYNAIQRIIEFPDAWSPLSVNTRRCLTRRFPFGIIYQPLSDKALILAVAQLNRKPDYWIDRVEENK